MNYTALKIRLDQLGMSALADEVDRMSPEARVQLTRLYDRATIEVRVPKFLQRRKK